MIETVAVRETVSEIEQEVRQEYEKIECRWLHLHYYTSVALVLCAFLIECVLEYVFYQMGAVKTPFGRYLLKYLLAPGLVNLALIAAGYWTLFLSGLSQSRKVYVVSLLFVAICFVLFTVHSIFVSLYLIFVLPIMLTIVYNNYTLTSITALCSITAKVASELLVTWDANKPSVLSDSISLIDFIVSLCILCAFYAVCIVSIRFEREKMSAAIQKEIEHHHLRQKLQTDDLTDVYNRIALREAFRQMEEDHSGSNYFFVMIDLDHFKLLNDTMGHTKGDLCLKEFGSILKRNCVDGAAFRFGGDEFCVLFRNRSLEAVTEVCRNIQRDFEAAMKAHKIEVPVSVSFGIAPYSEGITPTQLLKNTDTALYRSKKVRNTIRIYEA